MKGNLSSDPVPTYGVGTRFKTRGANPRECAVVDIHTTRNLAGEVVRVRYVATHEFMGQTITDRNVVEVTIAMGLMSISAQSGNGGGTR